MKLRETFADSDKSWSVEAKSINQATFDLSVKNPNGGEEIVHRSPEEIMDEIGALDAECAKVLGKIRGLESHLNAVLSQRGEGWVEKTLGDVCSIARGGSPRPIKKFITTAADGINL